MRRRLFHFLWPLLGAVVFLALLPGLQVLSLRYVPPPTTGTALQRWLSTPDGMPRPPWRISWTPARELPTVFFQLVWLAEDQRFFQHRGFDWVEIGAAWRRWQTSGQLRGASTITMQTARTIFLWQGRSAARKILEVYYTVWMELLLEKPRILELYANTAELGPGVYGLAAAALYWYGKPPQQLTRAEIAALVAILPNPLVWNPTQPSPVVQRRVTRLLRRAEQANFPPELGTFP